MSHYEDLADYLASDTAHNGPCLTNADLAEEEADSGPRVKCSNCGVNYVDKWKHITCMECDAAICRTRQQARNLVSAHYGHGGLAAGGRKRVDA